MGGVLNPVVTIEGNSGDKVTPVGDWSYTGPDANGYAQYVNGTAKMLINPAISVVGLNATGTATPGLLRGYGLPDTLTAGPGGDTLDGGLGGDTLQGSTGNDTIVFDANDTSVRGGTGTDSLEVKESTADLTAATVSYSACPL